MMILSIVYTDEGTTQAVVTIDMQADPAIDSASLGAVLVLISITRWHEYIRNPTLVIENATLCHIIDIRGA
jgi:hypothetical protein